MFAVSDQPTPPVLQESERLRQEQEDNLDEALKDTFPASDPIAPGRPHPSRPV